MQNAIEFLCTYLVYLLYNKGFSSLKAFSEFIMHYSLEKYFMCYYDMYYGDMYTVAYRHLKHTIVHCKMI